METISSQNGNLFTAVMRSNYKETGFVFDVKRLSKLIKDEVIELVDHKNLNLDVKFLHDKFCSTENLAIGIWHQLEPHLPQGIKLHCIKLYETPRIYVEYFGE